MFTEELPREFGERWNRHADELKWLYCEIYHGDEAAFRYFAEMLLRMWRERPESLRRLDREREANPRWYKGHNLVGMQMYVDAFAGTLRGVKERLDYISDCGVDYLHLMPLAATPSPTSGGCAPIWGIWRTWRRWRRTATGGASPSAWIS